MIHERIRQLREIMELHQINAYYIPGSDEHQNEYLPEIWKRREWISGFTGSYGLVIVTLNKAGLWTDSRYFLQAEAQMENTPITIFKMGMMGTPEPFEWVSGELLPGMSLGIDPGLVTIKGLKKIEAALNQKQIKIKHINENLVDLVWKDKPAFPLSQAVVYPDSFAGETVNSKLERLRQELKRMNCHVHILTKLDSIAWLYNIRGSDIIFNPVVISYAIISDKRAFLFIKKEKVTDSLRAHLNGLVTILEYDQIEEHLLSYRGGQNCFWIDDESASASLAGWLDKVDIYFAESPITYFKAVKNRKEIENFIKAHTRDGAALVKFLCWFDGNVRGESLTEDICANKLEEFRKLDPLYRGPSFATISAYKDHAAIVHYCHSEQSNYTIKMEGLYLVDSGGQYLDSTTDVTRTICAGKPTKEQKHCFTLVLKGHIDLSMTSFPDGTQGVQLDTIARKPLWDYGLDYGHGTGHGIGSYLNVHEGPHALSPSRGLNVRLKEGMFFSNEPGFYKPGEFGIRIENIVYIVNDIEKSIENQIFYKLNTVTLCPIDLRLVEKRLLSEKQLKYLNEYHKRVRDILYPLLNQKERRWLIKATRRI